MNYELMSFDNAYNQKKYPYEIVKSMFGYKSNVRIYKSEDILKYYNNNYYEETLMTRNLSLIVNNLIKGYPILEIHKVGRLEADFQVLFKNKTDSFIRNEMRKISFKYNQKTIVKTILVLSEFSIIMKNGLALINLDLIWVKILI